MFANQTKIDNIVSFIASEVEKNIQNDSENESIFLQWLEENKNILIQVISIEYGYEYDIVGSSLEELAELQYYKSCETYLDIYLKKYFNDKITARYECKDKCVQFKYSI